jgi:hypothetical protein
VNVFCVILSCFECVCVLWSMSVERMCVLCDGVCVLCFVCGVSGCDGSVNVYVCEYVCMYVHCVVVLRCACVCSFVYSTCVNVYVYVCVYGCTCVVCVCVCG